MLARGDRYIYLLYIQKLHRVKMRIPECHSAAPHFSHVVVPLLNKLLFLFCVRIPPTSRFFFYFFVCKAKEKLFVLWFSLDVTFHWSHSSCRVCLRRLAFPFFVYSPPLYLRARVSAVLLLGVLHFLPSLVHAGEADWLASIKSSPPYH